MEIPLSLLLVFLFSASSLLCQQQVNSQIADDDREQTILLKLKNDWKNPTLDSSWVSAATFGEEISSEPHCNWRGITCNHGFVTGITLTNINITKKIPPSICDLKNLAILNFSYNYIPGEFPTSLYNCSNLEKLDLYQNNFVGQIPSDIDKLSALRILNLGANSFTGDIPPSIGRFPVLETLSLHQNMFNGTFPSEISNLSNLQHLELAKNQFIRSRIPLEFVRLKKLWSLLMPDSNLIGEIPESIGNLTNLRYLDLSINRLNGKIPNSLFLLNNLTTLNLRANRLSGDIPRKIETLNLNHIDLSDNILTGTIPEDFGKLQYLRTFSMYDNRLIGEIPASIGLSGQIPLDINSWNSLYILNLRRNQLSGELSPEIGLLSFLQVLDLSENQISGEIPSEIGKLRFINILNLSSNRFTGKIPVEFENQTYARSFLNNSGLCTGILNLNPGACYSGKISTGLLALIITIAGVVLLVVILFVLFMIRHGRRKKHKQDLPAIWKLTLFQMLDFTESNILSSLTEDNVIGSGASGKVYRVLTNHSGDNNYVAVKKIGSRGKLDWQFEKQFQAEVQILGTIKHSSMVKLLCCISTDNSNLLVYEYMENGSLHEWLHKRRQRTLDSICRSVLDWPKRLEIAIGAARGLCYIHHDCSPPIIHRDVKSSNILLDFEFKARIADFGLAKMVVNHGEPKTTSVIAGSFGYIAPEYARTTKITEKIDVYSFGVVLLELATGRKANHGDEYTCLAEWAWRQYQEENNVDGALDEDVKKPCYLNEMRMIFKLGIMCTASLPSHRPSMKLTLQILQQRDLIIGTHREEEELALSSDGTTDMDNISASQTQTQENEVVEVSASQTQTQTQVDISCILDI